MAKIKPAARGIFLLLCMTLAMMLTGCTEKAKSEKEIVADLRASEQFISENLEISDYEIIKRQTDPENHSDVVYLTVRSDDPDLTCALTYKVSYILYNDGWILESVGRSKDGPWEFSGLSDEKLIEDVKSNDSWFLEWEDLNVQEITITDEGYNSNASTFYEKWISLELTASHTAFDYCAAYNVFYEISDGTWSLQNVDTQYTRYVPTYSPSISASDQVMESFEMDVAAGTQFDSFEYLRTDEDWEHCSETRYYTAKKTWFYGTETFLVSIPLTFYIADGDTHWSYDLNEITHSIQSVDWNIEGTWVNKYNSSSFPYISTKIEINTVSATDDPEVFKVNLSCDASSGKYPYLCKTNGFGDARLKYVESGTWFLYIDNSIATLDDDRAWYSFTLKGYSMGYTHEGFFWDYSSLSDSQSPLKRA